MLHAANLSILLIYVHTSINLADPVSQGILPKPSSCLPFRIPIPEELSPFITYGTQSQS